MESNFMRQRIGSKHSLNVTVQENVSKGGNLAHWCLLPHLFVSWNYLRKFCLISTTEIVTGCTMLFSKISWRVCDVCRTVDTLKYFIYVCIYIYIYRYLASFMHI